LAFTAPDPFDSAVTGCQPDADAGSQEGAVSPHSMQYVCVSFTPRSEKLALSGNGELIDQSVGTDVASIVGAALLTTINALRTSLWSPSLSKTIPLAVY